MSRLFFFFLKQIFFSLEVGKKNLKTKFCFFSFVWESKRKAAHFGQLNSFFDNSAVLRTGIFLIFIILLLS